MRAIMLAAGVGSRLFGRGDANPHKVLLKFGEQSLLQRHIASLRAVGVSDVTMVVGYHPEEIGQELERIGALDLVSTIFNPRYRRGALVSLWTARHVLRSGSDVLFMDADVLYDPALLRRLAQSRHANCFLLDRDLEPGDEPVKLCLKEGRPVEFGKVFAAVDHDTIGEWPGFLKVDAEGGRRLADAIERHVAAGRLDDPYEPAMRDVTLAAPEMFGHEDITGMAWIEIDFPTDLERARQEILPRIGQPAGALA